MKTICIRDRVRARSRRRGDRGFTMVELIVGLAIVVMLAAVVTPAITATIDRERVNQGADMLAGLSLAMGSFYTDINDNPSRLSHLTSPITTAQVNSCGNAYDNGDVIQWLGPYYRARVIPPNTGLPVFVGRARDLLSRTPSGPQPGVLGIMVDGAREEDVLALDRKIDGEDGATGGTIRWVPATEGLYLLMYYTPVTGC